MRNRKEQIGYVAPNHKSFAEKLNDLAKEGPLFSDSKLDKELGGENELVDGMRQSPSAAFGAIDRSRGPVWVTIAVLGIAFGLSACANTDDSVPSTISETPERVSPLIEYLGRGWDMRNDQEAQSEYTAHRTAQLHREQELIAQCMRDAGFEYLPEPFLFGFGTALVQPDDRDWISQWGFGVVAGPDGINDFWLELPPDPNEAIRSEFTPTELAAYHQALSGDWAGIVGVLPDDVPLGNRGCRGYAQSQIQAEPPIFAFELLQTDEWAPLQDAIAAMSNALVDSDAVLQAEHDWAMCMADAGYVDFSRRFQAESSIAEAFNRIPRINGEFAPIADVLIPELQEREIDLALADFDCRNQTDFVNRIRQARHNMEIQFVADHRATLEAFRNAFEQQS